MGADPERGGSGSGPGEPRDGAHPDRGSDRGADGDATSAREPDGSGDPGGHVEIVPGETARRRRSEIVELRELREETERTVLNLPNAITFLRALLVPVIFVLLAVDTQVAQWWAFAIFVFAAATDTIDGWVARRWYGVTRWGQFADPIADKLLVIGTLAALAWLAELPWWAVIVIAVREIAVTILRLRLIDQIDVVMPASYWGKSKTLSQLVAVAAYLLPGVPEVWRLGLLYIAVVLTVVSGVDYAFKAGGLVRDTGDGGDGTEASENDASLRGGGGTSGRRDGGAGR